VSYILDGGPSVVGIESTIIGIENSVPCVYRLGGLAIEEIEKVVGKVEMRINQSGDPSAPGQLKSHYAPRKPLFVGNAGRLANEHSSRKYSVLCFGEGNFPNAAEVYNLSPSKNDEEAALNLFKFLRLADEDDSEIVICDKLPDDGLGQAINDRLKRASVRA
jgi:L-threonylcarbamoyladenylate synthase